jgi:hypothetical protein
VSPDGTLGFTVEVYVLISGHVWAKGDTVRDLDLVDFRFSLEDWKLGPVVVEGFSLPSKFTIDLMLMDKKTESSLLWSTRLKIEFNQEAVPRALSVMTKGFTHSKTKTSIKKLKNSEPVELWQLEYVEKNLSELIALAVSCAAQAVTWESEQLTLDDEIVYSQQIEENPKQEILGQTVTIWDDPELYSKWALNNNFHQNNYDSGVEWKINNQTLRIIQENVIKRTRKRVWTDSFIKEVAKIHMDETQRAKNEGRRARQVAVVKTHFATNERTADSWIVEARKRGFLDPAPARKKAKTKN